MAEQRQDTAPVRDAPNASVNRGIQMPAHEIRKAISHAITVGKLKDEDVWHNTDVFGPGGKVCQMLEFAGYDVSSAYKCSSVIKPRFTRADGVRDNLKEQQFRFLFAYDHIYSGI